MITQAIQNNHTGSIPEPLYKNKSSNNNNSGFVKQKQPDYDTYIPEDKPSPDEKAVTAPSAKDKSGLHCNCNKNDKPLEKKTVKTEESDKDGVEKCTANTNKVDKEIQRLKEKKNQIEQELHSDIPVERRKELEEQLRRITQELQQKDNDSYRKQHTEFGNC